MGDDRGLVLRVLGSAKINARITRWDIEKPGSIDRYKP